MTEGPLVLVGAGNMGGAIAAGWLKADTGTRPVIVDPGPNDTVRSWAESGRIALNPPPEPAGTLVIAVKPQVFPAVSNDLRAWIGPQTRVISIMAGITIEALAAALVTARILRVMPNTPGAIGRGVALLAPGEACDEGDVAAARALLEPLGHVEGPMSEDMLSIATGLSGCGPAYVFLLAEVMAAGAAAQGVPEDLALRLARETVAGAAQLMIESAQTPAELRRAVTSPNGVTQAALDVLMRPGAMPSVMEEAMKAATARDRALSSPGASDHDDKPG